jgi:hypothetical protein
MAAAFSLVAASAAPLPLEKTFETAATGAYPTQDGWVVLSAGKSAYVAQGLAASGSKSFRLDSWPWSARMDYVTLDAIPDYLTYEASVYVDPTTGTVALVGFMKGPASRAAMWNYFRLDGATGRITFYGAAAPVDLAAFVKGQWYKVRADLNYKALTADLWVNDVLIAEDVAITPREFYYSPLGNVVTNQWGVDSPSSPTFSNVVYFDDLKLYETETTLVVEIDVKPGEEPDPINLRARGLLPVCVFSSEEFDATQIDPATCDLAGAPVAVRGRSLRFMAHLEDADGDGLDDLILQFENQQLDPTQLQEGKITLVGATYDGQEFMGEDDIVLVSRFATARRRR